MILYINTLLNERERWIYVDRYLWVCGFVYRVTEMVFAITICVIQNKNHTLLNGKMMRVMWSCHDSDARKSTIGNLFVKVFARQTFVLKIGS